MNPYNFNSQCGSLVRKTIVRDLKISHELIYKIVETIYPDGTIVFKNGKKYELALKEKK